MICLSTGGDCLILRWDLQPKGHDLEDMTHGVRTWGNDPNGPTVFLVGAYEQLSDISDRLLRALPPVDRSRGATRGTESSSARCPLPCVKQWQVIGILVCVSLSPLFNPGRVVGVIRVMTWLQAS